jgi:hypothetical protein
MNQQILMSSLSAYPASKASDMWLWQELCGQIPGEQHGNDEEEERSRMAARMQKILLTTRHSWAKNQGGR